MLAVRGLGQLLISSDKIKSILGSLARSEYCLQADPNKVLRDIIVICSESSRCPESNFGWTVFEYYLSHYPKLMPDYTGLRATAQEVKNTRFILDSIKHQFSKVGKQSDFPRALEAVLLDFLAMGNREVVERTLIAQNKTAHDFNRDRLVERVLFSGGEPQQVSEKVMWCIGKAGLDPNTKYGGKSVLLHCLEAKAYIAARWLIEKNGISVRGNAAVIEVVLSKALSEKDFLFSVYLVEQGAVLERESDVLINAIQPFDPENPKNNIRRVLWLIERGVNVNFSAEGGKTALSAAVEAGDVYSAIFLMEKGAKLPNFNVVPGENIKTQADYMWFEGALLSGCVEMCYWLAVYCPFIPTHFPDTFVRLGRERERYGRSFVPVINWMLDRGIDPNCTDEKGATLSDVILLAQGTDVPDIRLLNLLTERQIDASSAIQKYGADALNRATKCFSPSRKDQLFPVIDGLLINGVDINAAKPLTYADVWNQPLLVEKLLEAGACSDVVLANRVSKKRSQLEHLFEKKPDRGSHRFFGCFPWKDRNDEKEGESAWFTEEFCKPLKYTDLLRNEQPDDEKKEHPRAWQVLAEEGVQSAPSARLCLRGNDGTVRVKLL